MNKAWRSLCSVLTLRESSGVGPQLRKLYVKHLLALECAYDLEGRRDPVELAAACSGIKGRAKRITKEPPSSSAPTGALTRPLGSADADTLLPPPPPPSSDHTSRPPSSSSPRGEPCTTLSPSQISKKKGAEPGGWRELCQLFQISSSNSAAGQLKRQYDKYLFDFECVHERANCDPEPIRKALEPKKKKKRPAPTGRQREGLESLNSHES